MSQEQSGIDLKTALVGGIVIAVIIVGIYLICRPKKIEKIRDAIDPETAAEAKTEAPPNGSMKADVIKTKEHPPSVTDEKHARKNRKECRECITLCIEVLGLLGLFVYASLTYKMWSEAKQQTIATQTAAKAAESAAKAAQDQLTEMQSEQRPWVYAETPVFLKPITQNVNGVWEMRIEFTIHNTGHLPAMNVTPVAESPVPTFNSGDIIAEYQHGNCIDKGPDYSAITGDTIFPGQTVKRAITIGIWPRDIVAAIAHIHHVDPWIIGCFEYRLPNSPVPHFTRFAYIVSDSIDPRGSNIPADPSVIPVERLHVEPFPFKDSFEAD
jgi:hypothetical protein